METVNIDILSEADLLATALDVEEKTKEIFLDIVESILFKEKFVVTKAAAKYMMTDYMVNKSIRLLISMGLLADRNTINSLILNKTQWKKY